MSSYDQTLLDEAPKASRAQLQQGYDVDLLEPLRRTPSVHHPHSHTSQPTPVPLTSGAAETSHEKITSLPSPVAPRTNPSFWRSRNGIITIFVIVVVVVGAVVGGAVGGTVNKQGHNNAVSSTRSGSPTSAPYAGTSPSSSAPASSADIASNAPSPSASSSSKENIHAI